jgi:uncharacterized protein (TIGR02453 family)
MPFDGWPEDALDFYEGLEADNSKTYWTANLETYEARVRRPMEDLLAELTDDFGETKIFRPYRDVRFSKDKSPYKTAIAATVGHGYLQLSARGLAAGSGMYGMAPDQLDRYRRAVASDLAGAQLGKLIDAVSKHDIDVRGRETLKTVPRGYPPDHQRIDLLRCKGLVAWRDWPVEAWLGTAAVRRHVTQFLVATQPFADWLDVNVGPSAVSPRR